MHLELNCDSLAECYARAIELISVSNLMHKARIVIDIDTASPCDRSWIHIPDYTDKVNDSPVNDKNL